MRSILFHSKKLGAFLATVLFFSNSVFAYSIESNFWKDRRKNSLQESIQTLPKNFDLPELMKTSLLAEKSTGKTAHAMGSSSVESLLDSLSGPDASVRKVISPVNKKSNNVVVLIQDVHRNSEAQTHISSLLTQLMSDRSLSMVGLEGSFSQIDLARVRKFPYPASVKAAADYLLKEQHISGAVYAGLTQPGTIPDFVGVDDKSHYDANVQAVQVTAPMKAAMLATLEKEDRYFQSQKTNTFHSDLLAFDHQVDAYRRETLSLGDYVQTLNKLNKAAQFDPAYEIFSEALSMETSMDFNKVQAERTSLITRLVPKLSKNQTDQLMTATVQYRTGEMGHAEFYRQFETLCRTAQWPLNQFPEFKKYLQYVMLSDQIDVEKVLSSLKQRENETFAALTQSQSEKELIQSCYKNHLERKLVEFSLTIAEWADYKALGKNSELAAFESFYSEAEARNDAMVAHLLKGMKDRKASVAALVVGGFHSEGMTQQLKDKGVTVVLVAPKISQIDNGNGVSYLSAFTQEKTPLEQLLHGEKLFVSPPTDLDPGSTSGLAAGQAALSNPGVTPGSIAQALNSGTEISVDRSARTAFVKTKKAVIQVFVDANNDIVSAKAELADANLSLFHWGFYSTIKIAGRWLKVKSSLISFYVKEVAPFAESIMFVGLPLYFHSWVLFSFLQVIFIIWHTYAKGTPSTWKELLTRAAFPSIVALLSIVGFYYDSALLAGLLHRLSDEAAKPAAIFLSGIFKTPLQFQLGRIPTIGEKRILPKTIARRFSKATQISPYYGTSRDYDGNNYEVKGFLVPVNTKSTADQEVDEEQVMELLNDPRHGVRTVVVKDYDQMTYLAMHVIVNLMKEAQKEFTAGLATGGTTESLRKGLGLLSLAQQAFGQLPEVDKVKFWNTLDDYWWGPNADRKEMAISGYRFEQKYMLLENIYRGKKSIPEIEKIFHSPPLLLESHIADQEWKRIMKLFLHPEMRLLFQLHGIGTSGHDAFNEPIMDIVRVIHKQKMDLWKLTRSSYDRFSQTSLADDFLSPDRLTKILDITRVQNIGHFVKKGFHPFFLRYMGDQAIGDIPSLLNSLSMLSFEEINTRYTDYRGKYQFRNEQEYIQALNYILDNYQKTPAWALTQGTGGILTRTYNDDSVNLFMVSSPHKAEAVRRSLDMAPGMTATASWMQFAPRSIVIVTEDAATKLDKSKVFYLTAKGSGRHLITEENIEHQWGKTPPGIRTNQLLSHRGEFPRLRPFYNYVHRLLADKGFPKWGDFVGHGVLPTVLETIGFVFGGSYLITQLTHHWGYGLPVVEFAVSPAFLLVLGYMQVLWQAVHGRKEGFEISKTVLSFLVVLPGLIVPDLSMTSLIISASILHLVHNALQETVEATLAKTIAQHFLSNLSMMNQGEAGDQINAILNMTRSSDMNRHLGELRYLDKHPFDAKLFKSLLRYELRTVDLKNLKIDKTNLHSWIEIQVPATIRGGYLKSANSRFLQDVDVRVVMVDDSFQGEMLSIYVNSNLVSLDKNKNQHVVFIAKSGAVAQRIASLNISNDRILIQTYPSAFQQSEDGAEKTISLSSIENLLKVLIDEKQLNRARQYQIVTPMGLVIDPAGLDFDALLKSAIITQVAEDMRSMTTSVGHLELIGAIWEVIGQQA